MLSQLHYQIKLLRLLFMLYLSTGFDCTVLLVAFLLFRDELLVLTVFINFVFYFVFVNFVPVVIVHDLTASVNALIKLLCIN